MNWIGIAVGAGAGVVAVLISRGILRLLGKSEAKWGAVLQVVVFVAALSLGREVVEPRIRESQVEAELLKMPIYRAIQQYEPDAYKRIMTAFKSGYSSKQSIEEIWAATRPMVGEIASKRLPHASDAVLVDFARHIVDAIKLLHSKGGSVCFSYVNPTPGEAPDFVSLLGKEITQRELDLMVEIIKTSAGQSIPNVAESDVEEDLQAVIGHLSKKYSQADLVGLQNLNAPGIDKRKYCLIVADLYAVALALPEPRNSRLMRYLMQSQ